MQTPTLRQPTRHAHAITRQRHPAARTLAQPQPVLLAPGSGYRQAAGSGPVRRLQRRLTGLGFPPGPIDGRYGPLTTDAVERFQSASGLTIDGIVGARTLAALSARPSSGLAPGAGYRQAAGSGRVRVLQHRLAGLGFAPGPIDGRYGPLTTDAVERFQSARRLTVNGIVGTPTLRTLRIAQGRPTPIARPKSHPAPTGHSALPAGPTPAERSPAKPVTPLLLVLVLAAVLLLVFTAVLVLAAVLVLEAVGLAKRLSYGRNRARVRRTPARGAEMPRVIASELVSVHDADGGQGGHRR